MLPRYALPARESARTISLETKPKQVDAWLLRLPLSNPAEAAGEMADYLSTLNRIEVSHDTRAKIIERFYPVAEDVLATLHEQYGSVSLPLPPKQRQQAELAQRLLLEIADCYKILLLDWLGQRFHLFGGNPVPLYLQRILLAFRAVLDLCYETHANGPLGLWVEMHQTYNYALRNGMKDAVPEGSKLMQSLEHIYVSALILALGDPYHFPQSELEWTRDIIARYANLVRLVPAEEAAQGVAGLFLVEINTDAPPRPLAREPQPLNPRWELLLSTTELAKHLALLHTHLRGNNAPDKLGLPEVARDPAYAGMLHRLKLNWGASLQRKAQRRRHTDGREVEVGFGFKAVHQLISPAVAADAIYYGSAAGNEAPPAKVRCRIVNDSMGGLALHYKGGGLQIRVGDVVGLHQGRGGWSISLVRWFRIPAVGELFFGLQLLSPKGDSAQLRRLDNGRVWPGLMLLPNPITRQTPMLLSLPGAFVPGVTIESRTEYGKTMIQVDTRMESTPSVDLYRFQLWDKNKAEAASAAAADDVENWALPPATPAAKRAAL